MIVDIRSSKVVIVTVNYNGTQDTARLLSSLNTISEKVAVVVVDNCSKIKPLQLKVEFPKIDLVLSDVNGGFGYGNNLGVKHCIQNSKSVEYVFILNNDTVVSEGCIARLEEALVDSKAICVSPLIVYPNQKTIWFGGGGFSMKNVGAYSLYKDKPISVLSKLNDVFESPFVSGCAMFMRISDYKKLGGFDERFFMYVEDVDLAFRLNKIGRINLVKNAVITHYAHSSLGEEVRPLSKNNPRIRFYTKNVILGSSIFINKNISPGKRIYWKILLFIKWNKNFIGLPLDDYFFMLSCFFKKE